MICQPVNQRQRGSLRDRELVATVASCRALTTDQVWALHFSRIRHGRRKAQERLLVLHGRGELARVKLGEGSYCYFQEERPKQLAHLVGVNWARVWFSQLRTWERLHSYSYEQDFKIIRTDAFAAIRNTVTGTYRFAFVEFDRGTNEFDKVQKYNKFFERQGYGGSWWAKLTDRFPPVVVVTVSPARAEQIRQLVGEHNGAGLEFQVLLLENVRKEVISKCVK